MHTQTLMPTGSEGDVSFAVAVDIEILGVLEARFVVGVTTARGDEIR